MFGRPAQGNVALRVAAPQRVIRKRATPSLSCRLGVIVAAGVAAASIGTAAQSARMVGLGSTKVYGPKKTNVAGRAEAFKSVASSSGRVGALLVYVDRGSRATRLIAGLYTNASGRPGRLLGQGRLAAVTRGAWNTVSLAKTPVIRAGASYWIAVLGTGGTLQFRNANTGSPSQTSARTGLGSLPLNWATGKTRGNGRLSAYAVKTRFVRDTTAPSSPTGLSASAVTRTGLTLSWAASSDNVGVAGYNVYQGSSKLGTASGTSYSVSGLACGSTYSFAVEAYDAAGNVSAKSASVSASTPACADTTAPSSPTGLSASAVTRTGLTLSWAASSDNVGVTGYNVYQGSSKLGTASGTSYSVSGLACGSTYSFAVEAYDAAGNVSAKASVSVATATCSDPPPSSASVFLSPSGSDSAACTAAAPCKSFDRAYHVAQPGQVVQMAGGDYGGQSLNYDTSKVNASSNVLFQPAAGATVLASGELSIRASTSQPVAHVEFEDIRVGDVYFKYANHVVLRNVDMGFFFLRGTIDVKIIGGENYGATDGTSSTIGSAGTGEPASQDTLVDGVYFHDFNNSTSPGTHDECVFVQESSGTVIRNSTFARCMYFDVYLNPIFGGSVVNAVLDNNHFGITAPTGYYAVRSNVAQYSVTNNTFDQGISWDSPGSTVTGCGNTVTSSGFSFAAFLLSSC